MLLAPHHPVYPLHAEDGCGGRGIRVQFVLSCHAALLGAAVLEDPPLIIEQHGGDVGEALLDGEVVRQDWLASQHVQQLHPRELLAVSRTDQVSHQVVVPHMDLKHPRNHLLRLRIHPLVHFLVVGRQLIEGAFELVALTDESALVGAYEGVLFLLQLVLGVEDEYLAGDAEVLYLEVGVGAECGFVGGLASGIQSCVDGFMLYIHNLLVTVLRIQDVQYAQSVIFLPTVEQRLLGVYQGLVQCLHPTASTFPRKVQQVVVLLVDSHGIEGLLLVLVRGGGPVLQLSRGRGEGEGVVDVLNNTLQLLPQDVLGVALQHSVLLLHHHYFLILHSMAPAEVLPLSDALPPMVGTHIQLENIQSVCDHLDAHALPPRLHPHHLVHVHSLLQHVSQLRHQSPFPAGVDLDEDHLVHGGSHDPDVAVRVHVVADVVRGGDGQLQADLGLKSTRSTSFPLEEHYLHEALILHQEVTAVVDSLVSHFSHLPHPTDQFQVDLCIVFNQVLLFPSGNHQEVLPGSSNSPFFGVVVECVLEVEAEGPCIGLGEGVFLVGNGVVGRSAKEPFDGGETVGSDTGEDEERGDEEEEEQFRQIHLHQ